MAVVEPKFGPFAGIRNTIPVERLEPTDLAAGVNIDLDDAGRVSARPGRSIYVAGAAHSIWSPGDDSEPILLIQSGVLKRLSTADLTSTTTLASGLTDDRMRYAKVNGLVYHTNGRVTGAFDLATGLVRGWGLEIPPLPAITATLGDLTAGTYLYTMRAQATDGRVSGAPLSGRVDLADGAGLTFMWGDVDGTKVEIFVTEPNGEALYRAAVVPAGLGTYTWIGGRLALPLDTQFLEPAPAGQGLAYGNGRMYVAKGADVFESKALAYELFDLRDFLRPDGSRIMFVAGVEGGLYIGTEKAVYFNSGSKLAEATLRMVVAARAVGDSAVQDDASKVFGQGQGRVTLFATAIGVYAAAADGTVANLTIERFQFDAPTATAAALRFDPQFTQYILTA